jgi:hypothetical protein
MHELCRRLVARSWFLVPRAVRCASGHVPRAVRRATCRVRHPWSRRPTGSLRTGLNGRATVAYNRPDAPVAQLDRASAFEAGGHRFEPCRARQLARRVVYPRHASGKRCDSRCSSQPVPSPVGRANSRGALSTPTCLGEALRLAVLVATGSEPCRVRHHTRIDLRRDRVISDRSPRVASIFHNRHHGRRVPESKCSARVRLTTR